MEACKNLALTILQMPRRPGRLASCSACLASSAHQEASYNTLMLLQQQMLRLDATPPGRGLQMLRPAVPRQP